MPSTAQAGVASFFGGLARGISQGIQQRAAQKQAEKDARNKMVWDITTRAIGDPNQKIPPYELMAWAMNETGGKDPKIQEKVRHIMDQGSTLIPQQLESASLPTTSIGLNPPGGGVEPSPSEQAQATADRASQGPAPSPGRSVALKEAPRVPRAPEYMSADEIAAKQLERDKQLEEIRTKGQIEVEKARIAAQQASGKLGAKAGEIVYDGTNGAESGLDATGQPMVKGKTYAIHPLPDKTFAYVPELGRVDKTPEGELKQAFTDLNSSDPATRQAAQMVVTLAQGKIRTAALSQATASVRLDNLRKLSPVTLAIAQKRLSVLNWTQDERMAVAAGDPKTVLSKSNAAAAEAVTTKDSEFFGQNPVDVQKKLLSDWGFDYDNLYKQLHAPTGSALQSALEGGGDQGGEAAVPDAVKTALAGQAKNMNHKLSDGSVWFIDKDGNISNVSKAGGK